MVEVDVVEPIQVYAMTQETNAAVSYLQAKRS